MRSACSARASMVGIGMAPAIEQRGLVELAKHGLDVGQFEQPRPARDQQTQRQLHRRDVFHQIQLHQQRQHFAI